MKINNIVALYQSPTIVISFLQAKPFCHLRGRIQTFPD